MCVTRRKIYLDIWHKVRKSMSRRPSSPNNANSNIDHTSMSLELKQETRMLTFAHVKSTINVCNYQGTRGSSTAERKKGHKKPIQYIHGAFFKKSRFMLMSPVNWLWELGEEVYVVWFTITFCSRYAAYEHGPMKIWRKKRRSSTSIWYTKRVPRDSACDNYETMYILLICMIKIHR